MKTWIKIMVILTGIATGIFSAVQDIEYATYCGVMCLLFLYFYDDAEE